MATVTLTGRFTKLDGTAAEGTVRLVPSIPVIRDEDGNVVLSGKQDFPLVDGALSVELPATDVPGQPFTYRVWVRLHHDSHGPFTVALPADVPTVDLADLPWPTPEPPDTATAPLLTVSTAAPPPGGLWANPDEES